MNDQPDCAACRSGLANQAEQDRRARRRKLDAFDADLLALVDRAEAQATAPAGAAAGGVL